MTIDKAKIKGELVDMSNDVLAKYGEQDVVESVSVMNTQAKTFFIGSLKVYDEDSVKSIKSDLEAKFTNYGKLVLKDEKIVPCCAPKFVNISFNISIEN